MHRGLGFEESSGKETEDERAAVFERSGYILHLEKHRWVGQHQYF